MRLREQGRVPTFENSRNKSVTKTNSPLSDALLFGVGAATGGDRVSAEGKTGVRRQCATCSRSRRIASGITLRRREAAHRKDLCPSAEGVLPQPWVPFQGVRLRGKPAGRGCNIHYSRERGGMPEFGAPAEKSLIFRWGLIGAPNKSPQAICWGIRKEGAQHSLVSKAKTNTPHCLRGVVQIALQKEKRRKPPPRSENERESDCS